MPSALPLYSMPPEIWLNILAHLSEPDFLALKLASTYLRSVITNNASTICNTLIMQHYAQEASIIGTSFQDGWLVPTRPSIFREEKQLSRYASRRDALAPSRSRDPSPPAPRRRGPYHRPVRTKLSEPGPQYLRFLIEYSFEIRVASSMFIDVPARGKSGSCCGGDKETPQEKLDRWIGLYTVRRFLTRLHKIADGSSSPFSSFASDKSGEQDSANLKGTQEGLAWFYE